MSEPTHPIEIALRIPGPWSHPKELVERLPEGCELRPESLVLPDGSEVGFGAAPPDTQFAEVFRSSCRNPPTEEEWAIVQNYSVNVFLMGPGGSKELAVAMMRAVCVVLEAGGAGVFIDNSATAHGRQSWIEMTEDGGPDALSFAFVAVMRGRSESSTMGMHVLGFRDIVMKNEEAEGDFGIVDVLRYIASGDKQVVAGDVLADLDGPRYQVFAEASPSQFEGSPMYNPFGRWKIVSAGDIAESN